jgi:hypothetical protein
MIFITRQFYSPRLPSGIGILPISYLANAYTVILARIRRLPFQTQIPLLSLPFVCLLGFEICLGFWICDLSISSFILSVLSPRAEFTP